MQRLLKTYLVHDDFDVDDEDVDVTKLDVVEEPREDEVPVLFGLSIWERDKIKTGDLPR